MATSFRRPRRWLPALNLLALLALSVWAWRQVPQSQLIGHARVYGSVVVNGITPGPCRDWTMRLSLDAPVRPPGPAWILHEGKQLGLGYELHWRPEQAVLAVLRAPDQVLLGAITLQRMPKDLRFRRRGARLEVAADGATVLCCLDALGTADTSAAGAPPAWGCWTTGSLEASITLFDDSVGADSDPAVAAAAVAAQRARDRALLLVRAALRLDLDKTASERSEIALGAASAAIDNLPARHPERDHLRHWLALAEARVALARRDGDAVERASTAIDQLALLAHSAPVPESAGMLASLLPSLAERALARPTFPQVPALVLRARWNWLDLLGATAAIADDPGFSPDQRLLLQLLQHAAGCLLGGQRPATGGDPRWTAQPLPAPAEAPAWLLQRWRAFAGGNPDCARFLDLPLPRSDPFALALDQLVAGAGLEPVAAVSMRSAIDSALATGAGQTAPTGEQVRSALAALANAPAREAALARALLALHGIGSPESAHASLSPIEREGQGLRSAVGADDAVERLAERDPLAYALDRLLIARNEALRQNEAAAAARRQERDRQLGVPAKPDKLAAFAGLTARDPGALNYIWLYEGAGLPPAQALAVVLALQEADNGKPDWSLLRLLPCFTLPLNLMVPPEAGGAGPRRADPAPTPVP